MSLAIQWLRLCTSKAGDAGSIPGQGTKISHAGQHGQEKKNYLAHNVNTVKVEKVTFIEC